VFPLVALLAAVGIAACGSSKKSSTATTASTQASTSALAPTGATGAALDPAFVARVNTVCARAKALLSSRGHSQFPYQSFDPLHPDPKLLPRVGAYFAAVRPLNDQIPVQLASLGSPQKGQALWSSMAALAKQDRVIADRQISAAQAANAPAFVATVTELQGVAAQIRSLAVQGGFSPSSPCNAIF
jgi:hypothetical protein